MSEQELIESELIETVPAVDPDAELARKNMLWGWALLGLFCLLFGGTAAVAFIYLWLS